MERRTVKALREYSVLYSYIPYVPESNKVTRLIIWGIYTGVYGGVHDAYDGNYGVLFRTDRELGCNRRYGTANGCRHVLTTRSLRIACPQSGVPGRCRLCPRLCPPAGHLRIGQRTLPRLRSQRLSLVPWSSPPPPPVTTLPPCWAFYRPWVWFCLRERPGFHFNARAHTHLLESTGNLASPLRDYGEPGLPWTRVSRLVWTNAHRVFPRHGDETPILFTCLIS